MNKGNLIDAVAQATRDSKASAARTVNAVLEAVRTGLEKDGHVLLAGFGTFSVKERPPRRGRNPRNGEPIEIPASVSIHFRPSPDWRHSLANALRHTDSGAEQASPGAEQAGPGAENG